MSISNKLILVSVLALQAMEASAHAGMASHQHEGMVLPAIAVVVLIGLMAGIASRASKLSAAKARKPKG